MKEIIYSAPGKVILSGEHAVVYGKPALVCAIDKRFEICIIPAKKTIYTDSVMPFVEKAVRQFLLKKNIPHKLVDYTYTTQSSLPIGRGLGSSSAFATAGCAALLELYTKKEWSREEVNNCAHQVEKLFYKNASGVDNTAATFGGLIYFRKEFEFLKTISSLSLKIPISIAKRLFLIDTGKPDETTGEMVEMVGKLYNKRSAFGEKILQNIEKSTKRMVVALAKEDVSFFKKSIVDNQKELEYIGVVSPSTKKMLQKWAPFGGGKITGGGGYKNASGFVLFFADDPDVFLSYMRNQDREVSRFCPSYNGLQKRI